MNKKHSKGNLRVLSSFPGRKGLAARPDETQETAAGSKDFWKTWVTKQYQKSPFSLPEKQAKELTDFFADHLKMEFSIYPNHLLETFASFQMEKCETKDEYLYYLGLKESVGIFNKLVLTLMYDYPCNPAEYREIQKTLDFYLSSLDFNADTVLPAAANDSPDDGDDFSLLV